MSVFISHKQEDSQIAKYVNNYLISKGIKCYLDVLDPTTIQVTDITSLILSRLNGCTHLIAILSNKSQNSWWVPFEIGAAHNTNHRIASYLTENISLPSYLDQWPQMRKESHLEKFAQLYKVDSMVKNIIESRSSDFSDRSNFSASNTASKFHTELKNYIRTN